MATGTLSQLPDLRGTPLDELGDGLISEALARILQPEDTEDGPGAPATAFAAFQSAI